MAYFSVHTVIVFDGATELGVGFADSTGHWAYATGVLAQGDHDFSARAHDQSGNTSAASSAFSVTIDSTGPAAPVIASFSDDTGSSNADGQTADNTLTFTGTATAGETVNIYVGGTIVATGVTDGTGHWTATTGALSDGYTSFTARAVDTAGNNSPASDAMIVIIDTTAPVAPVITGYSNDTGIANDGITSDSNLTLTGTATDGATTVAIYDGATLLGTTTVSSGTWSFNTGTLAEGDHDFTAVSKDTAGNISVASTALDVTLDFTAPAPATITSYGDDTGSSPSDHITSDNQQTLSGTAPEGSNVIIYDNGIAIGTVAASGTSWSFTTPTLADGNHAITVRSSDVAGNQSAASSTLSLTIDTAAPTAPEITGFSNDTGVQNDGLTSDTTLTLTGTAAQGSAVDIYDGAAKIGSTFVDGSGQWTFDTSTLSEGAHDFTAIARDSAGNVSTTSDALAVTIDTTPDAAPTITGFSDDTGTPGDSQTSDQTLTFTGTAGAGETVNVYWNGAVIATGIADGSGNWSATSDTLAGGYYSLEARTVDASGNASTASNGIVVIIDTIAPDAPVITGYADDTGTPNDGITADNTLVLSGTAEASSTVVVYDGATQLGSAIADSAGSWSFTTATLANGDHSFTATATDRAGNVGDASAALAVTVSVVPLSAPVISSFSTDTGSIGDSQTADNTLTFTGTATAGLTVNVYEGTTLVATGIADGDGHWTATTEALSDGYHAFNAQVTNGATTSNWSTTAVVVIDTVAPAAPSIVSFSNDTGTIGDGITSDNTVALSGTGEANTNVSVYDGATLLGTANVDVNGNWTYTTTALSDGTHSFTAVPRDAAGNVGTASSAFDVTVDTTRPDTPVITGYSDNSGNPNDYITNDNTLTFTGTAEANQTVNIYLAGNIVATGVADGDGHWSATTSVLADSNYASFTARAVDAAGNLSLSSGSTVVAIDTVAPAAPAITGYSNDTGIVGDGITYDQTLALSGTTENGSKVSIYDGATLLGTASVFGGSWTFTTGTLAAGEHSLTAVATDLAGNTGAASAALDVTIDLSRPDAPTITAFSDNSGNPNDFTTNDNTLTFTGTAEAGVNISIYLAGNVVATGVADASGHWSVTTGVLADSGYASFTARASYASGYPSANSSPMIVAIDTVAPDAPTISSFSNDSGVVGDGLTNDNTITLSGTASNDANGVSLYDGATLLGIAIVSGGQWTYTTNTLGDGEHSFTAVASDYAGNLSAASAATVVTIDTTLPDAPTITGYSDNSGNPNDYITNDNTLTFTGTAAANQTVNIYLEGNIVATGVADSGGHWSATTSVLADSSYAAFTAKVVDDAGNVSQPSSATIVAIDTVAPDAPTITGFANDTGTLGDGITSDNTLTLSGTAATGTSTVAIYDGATLLGTAQVSSGNWTFNSAVLADGDHSFTAQAIDTAGNSSAASAALDVTVSAAALSTPVISGFSDDTGVSGDGQTSDNTLTFTGTADAGTTVNVYAGTSLVATGTADGTGHWTATSAALDDGYYSFTAQSTNGATTSANSDAVLVIVDTVAPAVPVIESFANDTGTLGDGITSDSTLTLSGTADSNTNSVSIFDGATLLGTAHVIGGAWTYTTATLSNGEHDFSAVASDAAGNVSASTANFVVTVDASTPSIPTFNAANYYTNDNTPTFSGTADANVTVNVYVGGTIIATGIADGTGHWTATAADPLPDGYTSFNAKAVNEGGTASGFSGTQVLQIDTTPPSAPVVESVTDNGGAPISGATGDTTPTLHGTAEAGTQQVQIYDGATLLGTAYVNSGNWTYTTTTLTGGEHDLTAKGVDFAGNVSDASTAFSVNIDTTPPAAPVITSAGGYTSDNTPTFTGTAEADTTINVYLGSDIVGTGVTGSDGNWTVTVSNPVNDGYAGFTVSAVDGAGNKSTSVSGVLFIDTVAPAAAVITGYASDTGTVGDHITADNTIQLTGTAESGTSQVLVYDGATLLGTAFVNGGAWTYTTGALADGEHNFTAVSRDYAGNSADASAALAITIDATPPAIPVFTSAGGYTSDSTPTFEGTADAGVTVNVYLGGAVVASGVADGTGHWTATVANSIADGYQYFTAKAINDAGVISASTDTHVVAIDTVAPAAPAISGYSVDGGVIGDGLTNDATPTLSGTTVPGTQYVNVYDGTTLLGTTIANGNAWTYTTGTLAEGDHVLTARAVDYAGNVSDPSAALNLSIDTTPPDAPTLNSQGTYLTDNTPTFTGTAAADATVYVYLGGSVIATGIADGTGHWSATASSALSDGYSIFSASTVDAAGNVSSPSAAYIAFVDTTPPDVPTITGFANDTGTIGDGITTDHTLELSGTAVTGTNHVNIYDGGTLLGTANLSGNNWTFTTGTLSDGEHNFTVTASDYPGNESAASASLSVTVDPVAPLAAMSSFMAAPAVTADTDENHAATFDKAWLLGDSSDKSVIQSVSSTSEHGSAVTYDAHTDTVTYNPQGSAEIQALNTGQTINDSFTYTLEDGSIHTKSITIAGVDGYSAPDGTSANDNFYTGNPNIDHINGGAGTDTLHFQPTDAASHVLDLTQIGQNIIQSVERIDLTGGVNSELTLNAKDILSMSGDIQGLPGSEQTRLTVVGDASDSVTVADSGWTAQGHLDVSGISFNVFEHGSAQLLVQSDIPTNGLPSA